MSEYKINHTLHKKGESYDEPVPAASVMLVRDHDNKVEVFMIKRSMKTNFGGAWVFPGGKIDKTDDAKNYAGYSHLLDDVTASQRLGTKSNGLSYWIACIRECFEESGILLVNEIDGSKQKTTFTHNELKIINQHKEKLLKGNSAFNELLDKLNFSLATNELAYISHWITPKIEKRRYSTRFFVARTTHQEAIHDGSEGVESQWINPQIALSLYHAGNYPMIMPTIKNLELIKDFSDTNSLLIEMNKKEENEIPRVEPVFKIRNGKPELISY